MIEQVEDIIDKPELLATAMHRSKSDPDRYYENLDSRCATRAAANGRYSDEKSIDEFTGIMPETSSLEAQTVFEPSAALLHSRTPSATAPAPAPKM